MNKAVYKKLAILTLTLWLPLTLLPGIAAGAGFTITGDNGLEIKVPEKTVDTGNLNPGDSKQSCLKLTNSGSETLTVYIRTNIKDEKSPRGGNLAQAMTLTIKDGDKTIAAGTLQEVNGQKDVLIGDLAPGQEKIICFFSHLPTAADNDYQRAAVTVNWTFTTETTGGGSEPTDPEKPEHPSEFDLDRDPRPGPPEEIEIPPEKTPVGRPELLVDPPLIEIPEEPVPTGPQPDMPKTGEGAHTPYYLLGGLALLIGAGFTFKRKGE